MKKSCINCNKVKVCKLFGRLRETEENLCKWLKGEVQENCFMENDGVWEKKWANIANTIFNVTAENCVHWKEE